MDTTHPPESEITSRLRSLLSRSYWAAVFFTTLGSNSIVSKNKVCTTRDPGHTIRERRKHGPVLMVKQIKHMAQFSDPGYSDASLGAVGGSILESGGHFTLGLEDEGPAEPVSRGHGAVP